ncbi:hypothetical protein HN748_06440 [Candidatus Peregrinibacteria bacterium]|jgi:L-malate glycosyltransferase|nr:hypothetical protein [Candidatus Peregrinibacteria bacterium]MBT7483139.1 hypothetical protein [Candidatus Peregrinibacteria bacterium]MBT7703841.1 hypothetical protein [Candidatus Peregrinibacteria bacterium]
MTKPTWIICGNFGAGNLGDEAILRGLLELWGKDKNLIIMSANPAETELKFGIKAIHRLPSGIRSTLKSWICPVTRPKIRKAREALKNCDRFILGGGTLLTDEPLKSMFVWGKQIKGALKYNKKIEIYANGIGPLNSKWAQKKAKSLLEKADKISVRDEKSLEWTNSLGIKQVELVDDPALHLKELKFQGLKKFSKNTIILTPRFWKSGQKQTLNSLKKFVQYLCVEQGKYMVGIPFEKANKKDLNLLSKIFDQQGVRNQSEIWANYKSEEEVLGVIQQAELLVGMRLHSLVFAHLTNTPFISIAYMEKVSAIVKTLNSQNPIIELKDLSFEKLKQAYERLSAKVS